MSLGESWLDSSAPLVLCCVVVMLAAINRALIERKTFTPTLRKSEKKMKLM